MSARPSKPSSWYNKLLPEQAEALEFTHERLKDSGGVCLFCQQRTGKTYVTTALLERLELARVLIIAPLMSLEPVWEPALSTLPGQLLRNPQDARSIPGAVILLIHPELFAKHAKRLAKLPWDLVVIDESQQIKARNSGRSRAARRFRHCARRLALSGTPIDDSPIDVWAQMRFVDCEVFGEDWLDFAERQAYCKKSGFMGKQWTFIDEELPRFLEALKDHIFRLTIEFMKLKPVTVIPVPIVLLGEQERIYQTMDKKNIIRLSGERIMAPLPITRDVKKSQITGGFVLTDDGEAIRVGYAKERKLRALFPRLELPLVIFCQFLHEIAAISTGMRASGMRVATLHGGVKTKRAQILREFDKGKYDVILCQVRTGGVSIDLTRACNMVFYSFSHSFIDFEQILFRLQGLRQTRAVKAYLLYCVDTIDEEKVNEIERKSSTAYSVLSHFERTDQMAKKAAKKVAKKVAVKADDAPAFGVAELAKHMDVEPATCRVKLRAANIKKSGKGYGWKSKTEMEAVAKKLAA